MKIAIDCRFILKEISGIGKYTETLIDGLTKSDTNNSYLLFFNDQTVLTRTADKFNLTSFANIQLKTLNYSPFSLKNQISLPFFLKNEKVDILHVPEFMLPLFARTKTITTIHDIILISNPKFSPKAKKSRLNIIYKFITKLMAKKADRIITVSNFSKEDLHNKLNIQKNKIAVVYNGIDKEFFPISNNEKTALLNKYGYANNKIIFYAGRQDPYKNVQAAIKTFILYKESSENKDTKLIILGKKDKRYPEDYNFAKNSKYSDDIIFTGYLDDKALVDHFKMGHILLFLSLYEGFGLPVAESMACGVPVICSDRASLPEVAAHPFSLNNPDDIKKISEKLHKILNNSELYDEIKEAGLKKVKEFSPQNMAQAVLKQYREIKNTHEQ